MREYQRCVLSSTNISLKNIVLSDKRLYLCESNKTKNEQKFERDETG